MPIQPILDDGGWMVENELFVQFADKFEPANELQSRWKNHVLCVLAKVKEAREKHDYDEHQDILWNSRHELMKFAVLYS